MLHKNTNQKEIDSDTFPFTYSQIKKFKDELDKAGGFDELMLEKQALIKENGIFVETIYEDSETYEKTFLTGIYESLRPFYDTDMPYSFWSLFYEALQKREGETE